MLQYLVIALITTLIALGGFQTVAKAETVDVNVKIEGIICDLDAVYAELGYVPTYCANRPEPIDIPAQTPPVSPVILPHPIPMRALGTAPSIVSPIHSPQFITLLSPKDLTVPSKNTFPTLIDLLLMAFVLIASIGLAIIIDIVYYGRTLTNKIWSFFIKLFKY